MAVHRMVRVVDPQLADQQLWAHGRVGEWRRRMEDRYARGEIGAARDEGLEAVYARDPKV